MISSTEPLLISFPSVSYTRRLGSNTKRDVKVTLNVLRPFLFLVHIVLNSKLGLVESYVQGAWKADSSPKQFLSLLIRNRRHREGDRNQPLSNSFARRLFSALSVKLHSLLLPSNFNQFCSTPNTPSQSVRNAKAHYDLGNELFQLFLDPSMTYSCALFSGARLTFCSTSITTEALLMMLHGAQMQKYDALLDILGELGEQSSVLEIGCGWGGFGIRAVGRFGCRWTGLTLSTEQLRLAQERVRTAEMEDKMELKLLDYRLESGMYDHVIAVEMIEAVGHEFLATFFAHCSDRLKPGGKLCLQAILCPDEKYELYRSSTDFIRKHIFPGGHLPSLEAIRRALPAELSLLQTDRMDSHYALTLDIWRELWLRNKTRAMAISPSERFFRKWDIYLSLCSALFENNSVYLARILFVKRFNRTLAELDDD